MVAKAQGHNFVIVPGRGACRFPGVQRMFGKDQYELMPLRLTSTLEQARDADYPGVFCAGTRYWCPTIDWSQGGPIIERIKGFEFKQWLESKPATCCEAHIHNYEGDWVQFGPTPLIAAMRCFVVSRLGNEVEVPEELLKQISGTKHENY
jgi:hypothetical protein